MSAKKPATEKKGRARPEDVLKAAVEAMSMPREEFDAELEKFEAERDRKAKEALAKKG